MWRVAIAGSVNDDFFIAAGKRLSGADVRLEKFDPGQPGRVYDALLVFPDTDLSKTRYECRILIIPDESVSDEEFVRNASAQCVITYGLSPKNTVTLSSTKDSRNVVALQRDILSLDNSLVLRQEFALNSDLPHYETMALASLLAVSGVLEL